MFEFKEETNEKNKSYDRREVTKDHNLVNVKK
jgi:hypothetical protein